MLTGSEISAVVNDVLRKVLGPHGFERADVDPGVNFDGEPSLRVTAHFRLDAGVTDGAASTAALSELRHELAVRGEERFPYIRYDYPNDEILEDDIPNPGLVL